jgi:hypothetical protein
VCVLRFDVPLMFLCVCVLRFNVPLTEKKGENVMTPNFNNENLSHPFTGTTLHMVTSISTPERIEGFRQFCSLSVFAASHRRFVAFPFLQPLTRPVVGFV